MTDDRRPQRSHRQRGVILALAMLATGLAIPATLSAASAIARQSDALRRLEVEVAGYDARFTTASADYRAANARLTSVRARIRVNSAELAKARKEYEAAQKTLATRLSAIYRQPQPSGIEVLLQSGSVTDALSRFDFMNRVQNRDSQVVAAVGRARQRIKVARAQLVKDQESARKDTATTRARLAEIGTIRSSRRRALVGVRRQLIAMIAAERNAARVRALQAAQRRVTRRIAQNPGASPSAPAPVTGGGVSPPSAPVAAPSVNIPSELAKIAQCESGGNPAAVSGSGTYRGKYQFDVETWKAMGGTGDPAAASEAEQDRRAAILYGQRGAAPWPVCGR